MSSPNDDVHIYPDQASFAEVAKDLLAVANRPKDVRTTTDGPVPLGLVVSQELYQRYLAAVDAATFDEASSSPKEPKKRGRPRKDTAPESETTP